MAFCAASVSPAAEPGALVRLRLRVRCGTERGHHFQIIFGHEVADGQFALHQHGQRGRLHAAHRKLFAIGQRIGARKIHAHQPVGAAASAGGIGQRIVVAARAAATSKPWRMASGVSEEIHRRLTGFVHRAAS